MPDGLVVKLNSGSKLLFPKLFEGETFFEFARNVQQPFSNRSGELVATAVGTSFNARAYSVDQPIEVAMDNGKVILIT